MKLALKEAHKAAAIDEVPVGAVIVLNDKVIARGFNKREINNDPLGHAEMIAIRKASKKLNNWRLVDCELYVTVEPCAMCAGAIMWSRLQRVVYGTGDPKGGWNRLDRGGGARLGARCLGHGGPNRTRSDGRGRIGHRHDLWRF